MPDQDAIEQQRELLAIHRQSLAFHLKQLAKLGEAFAPPGLFHSISEARAHIRALKGNLRQSGVDVEDLPLDDDASQSAPLAAMPSQVSSQSTLYKTLWGKIEEIHILVRVHNLDQQTFDKDIQSLNIFLIKHSLDIDEQDKQLANRFLESLYKLKGLVSDSGNEQEKRSVEITATLAAEDFQSAVELQQLVEHIADVRNRLYQRVRHIINASI